MTTTTTTTTSPESTPAPAARPGLDTSKYESLTGATDLPFPEYDAPPAEPLALARQWIADAAARGVREPRSLALATATRMGHASNRIVTIARENERGFVFTTHSTSRKGRELADNCWASGVLYWRESGRQLILSGPVTPLTAAESDELWAARPTPLHSMTTASHQSDQAGDLDVLREEALRLAQGGRPLPRPERFTGYLLEPAEVEFWNAASDRLHRRLAYTRLGCDWHTSRLQP
ncbi:phenazine biosynthesis FMN-dependent oxidase PhzG [Streptomyces sp. G-G2]|uniref:phenazine biosynthesis FMN-dependent oxidase PhzG n=1 Tax=Streptomyces sp. G-G2 TaxID=3046201 RepID=UPI0024B9B1CF|nr:phenazine biosynthesis FMN-dependent oxidase PhzG [Streptomyces sp. G-G2]MDJ0382907.1 phenazine biosynthesis FMN-dependent oxidase PhzG [Streptomyces sp. G-G2]